MNIFKQLVFKYIEEWEKEKPVRDLKADIVKLDIKLARVEADIKDIGRDDPLATQLAVDYKQQLLTAKSDKYNELIKLDNK
jgi:hypothetical protein